ncbi:hypothetical protein [Micropruina sonneratiae]|uniref:hypothetical protein n=1 Tax=Micropruina sonneratiae TaxID=2986940 RepID=UPI002226A810|nr:hypothetical protein [Micropruina sp. KQZ13P-5]MCW3157451.1 hypothetical protein [Micropruina sp. KQZ13P-5]
MSLTSARALTRSAALLLSTVLLGLVGLGASTPAQAVSEVAVDGVGSGPSQTFTLNGGYYRFDLAYAGNSENGDVPQFYAQLEGRGRVSWLLAWDYETGSTITRFIEVPEQMKMWIVVKDAADDASWSVDVSPVAEPTSTVTSLKVSGTGPDATTLSRVKTGTYYVTYTYSNNYDAYGATDFYLGLNESGNGWQDITHRELSASGSGSATVKIGTTGTYWFETLYAGKNSSWSVTLAPFKKLTAATPKISGTAKVGKTLTAKAGTWTSGAKLTYQWYRGSSKISGATKSTYKLTSASKGKNLKVKVTGKKAGYTTVTKTSAATATVKK